MLLNSLQRNDHLILGCSAPSLAQVLAWPYGGPEAATPNSSKNQDEVLQSHSVAGNPCLTIARQPRNIAVFSELFTTICNHHLKALPHIFGMGIAMLPGKRHSSLLPLCHNHKLSFLEKCTCFHALKSWAQPQTGGAQQAPTLAAVAGKKVSFMQVDPQLSLANNPQNEPHWMSSPPNL